MNALKLSIQSLGEHAVPEKERTDRVRVFAAGVRTLAKQLCISRESVLDAVEGHANPVIQRWLAKRSEPCW